MTVQRAIANGLALGVALLFLLVLFGAFGCAPALSLDAYVPEIHNPSQYDKDQADCQVYASNYKGKLDGGLVVVAGAQGAANNASEAPINAVIPLAGAAGGAGSAIISAVDPFGSVKRKIYLTCLDKKTTFDHSALMLEPMQ